MADAELLQNIVLSRNPCPICLDAADQEPMTLEEWAESEWGLPGSSTRYCEDDCHCVLMPVALMDEFPAISERVHLRGEEGTDIRAIVEIGPAEAGLKEIMDKWNEDLGKIPEQFYHIKNLAKAETYLRELYAKWVAEGRFAE